MPCSSGKPRYLREMYTTSIFRLSVEAKQETSKMQVASRNVGELHGVTYQMTVLFSLIIVHTHIMLKWKSPACPTLEMRAVRSSKMLCFSKLHGMTTKRAVLFIVTTVIISTN
jgi:hypothetical protein